MVQDLDIRYPRSHCPSNIIALKVKTQEITAKDFYPKEPKVKNAKPTLSRAVEASKPSKQARKKKKKKKHQERQNKEQTSASTANAIKVEKKKKKKKKDRDISKVTCFNCDKKDHYTSTYTKLLKN